MSDKETTRCRMDRCDCRGYVDMETPAPQPSQDLRAELVKVLDRMMWAFTGSGVKGTETTAAADAIIALIENRHAKSTEQRFCPNIGCQIVGPHKHIIEGPAEDRHAK